MKIKKSWLSQLDFMAVSKNGYINEDERFIVIEHTFMRKVTDQKIIKLDGIEEVEVDQAGFFKQLMNFGTLILKGQGISEQLMFVKSPAHYRNYLIEIKEK